MKDNLFEELTFKESKFDRLVAIKDYLKNSFDISADINEKTENLQISDKVSIFIGQNPAMCLGLKPILNVSNITFDSIKKPELIFPNLSKFIEFMDEFEENDYEEKEFFVNSESIKVLYNYGTAYFL